MSSQALKMASTLSMHSWLLKAALSAIVSALQVQVCTCLVVKINYGQCVPDQYQTQQRPSWMISMIDSQVKRLARHLSFAGLVCEPS